MKPHEWMDSMADHACRHGGPCTMDHKCDQGRCHQRNGPQPMDRRYLCVMGVATVGLWGVLLWAVLSV